MPFSRSFWRLVPGSAKQGHYLPSNNNIHDCLPYCHTWLGGGGGFHHVHCCPPCSLLSAPFPSGASFLCDQVFQGPSSSVTHLILSGKKMKLAVLVDLARLHESALRASFRQSLNKLKRYTILTQPIFLNYRGQVPSIRIYHQNLFWQRVENISGVKELITKIECWLSYTVEIKEQVTGIPSIFLVICCVLLSYNMLRRDI